MSALHDCSTGLFSLSGERSRQTEALGTKGIVGKRIWRVWAGVRAPGLCKEELGRCQAWMRDPGGLDWEGDREQVETETRYSGESSLTKAREASPVVKMEQ